MSENLDSSYILRLNGNYQRLGWSTARQVLVAMNGGLPGSAPYLGLDIHYEMNPDGTPNYNQLIGFNPLGWDDWVKLPIRPWDKFITGARLKVRIPTVVICPKFRKMVMKEQRATPAGIRRRDGNKCQYTGVPLTNKTFSLDHVVPRSKGGKDTWENLVASHREVNSRKGDKFNHEAGLKLLKRPVAPQAIPACALVTENKHPDHEHFA